MEVCFQCATGLCSLCSLFCHIAERKFLPHRGRFGELNVACCAANASGDQLTSYTTNQRRIKSLDSQTAYSSHCLYLRSCHNSVIIFIAGRLWVFLVTRYLHPCTACCAQVCPTRLLGRGKKQQECSQGLEGEELSTASASTQATNVTPRVPLKSEIMKPVVPHH